MRLEDQTSKLHITDGMASPDDGSGTPEHSGSHNESGGGSAPSTTSKPKRVRTGCLTCRERHLKCDEAMPVCQNCRKSSRTCKRGVRLNFIDTQVRDTKILPPAADWQVGFVDESREIASEYRGGAARYPVQADPDAMDILKEGMAMDASSAPPAPMMAHQPLPPIQPPSATMANAPYPSQYSQTMQESRSVMHQHNHSNSSQTSQQMYPNSTSSYDGGANGAVQGAPPQVNTSCLISPDETLFMQVFVEEVGLWMDSMDPHKHFSRILPFFALSEPMLLNAFLACGARHLTLVNSAYTEDKALHYYDTATRLLLKSLQNPNRDTIICATAAVILNVYEVMCERALQRMNHIAGARALIKECGWSAKTAGIGAACFWLNVGMELFSCLHFNWQVAWNPDEWGVDMNMPKETQAGMEEQWTYKIIYITAKMANFRASIPKFQDSNPTAQAMRLQDRLNQWDRIKELAERWNANIPRTMHPMAYLQPHQLTQLKSHFPEVWLIKRTTIVARLFYHTTMCLLPQTHPTRPATEPEMYELKVQHARMICGIVAHVKDRGVASAAIRCVAIAAECLENYEEQAEILQILEKIHKETGWGITFLPPELKKKWGWTDQRAKHSSPPTHTASQQQQMASAAAGMLQSPPATTTTFGFSAPGSTPTTLPPVPATQMPSPPSMPSIPSGIVNPLMRQADFNLSQHPYQNDYVAPNHPTGQDGGLFTRLMESGMYQHQH